MSIQQIPPAPRRLLALGEQRRLGLACRRPEGRGGSCWEECLHCPALSVWRAAGPDPWDDTQRVGGLRLAELFLDALARQGRSPAELMAAVVVRHRSGSWSSRLRRLLAGQGAGWLHVRRFALALDLRRERVIEETAADQLEAERRAWSAGLSLGELGHPAGPALLERYGAHFAEGATLIPVSAAVANAVSCDLAWSGHGWLPLTAVWSSGAAQPFLLVAPRPDRPAEDLERTCRELVQRHRLRGFAACARFPVVAVHLPDTPPLILSAVAASRWEVLTAACDLLGEAHGLQRIETGLPAPVGGRTGGFPPGHLGASVPPSGTRGDA